LHDQEATQGTSESTSEQNKAEAASNATLEDQFISSGSRLTIRALDIFRELN
jgi:hypothetical protein